MRLQRVSLKYLAYFVVVVLCFQMQVLGSGPLFPSDDPHYLSL